MPSIVVTGFVPKELINVDAIRLELLNALRSEGREIRRELRKTTATWTHKVLFEMKVSLRRTSAEGWVKVWTTDEIFGYVNEGTPPHIIRPKTQRRWAAGTGKGGRFRKRAKVLAFPSKTRPKTRPGALTSGPGGSSGPMVFRPFVHHPGTKARDFTEAVVERMEKTRRFQKRLDDAIGRGLAKSDKGTKVIK